MNTKRSQLVTKGYLPKMFTTKDIRSWKPCYDPEKYLSENWSGTVFDIVQDDRIPWPDRLWVVCRSELLSDKLMRLFAVWCARQVQHLMTDDRSIKALDVAERFANGEASEEERAAAWDAAWDAWDAAWDAARYAAWDARAAAWDAAWDAAEAAARAAARAAAWDARDAARDAARAVARAVARAAAWDAQKSKLIEMLEAGLKTGDVK